MIRAAASALLLALAPPAFAQDAPLAEAAQPAIRAEVQALYEALRLPEILAVMSEEGIADGDDLAASVFGPGPVPGDFADMVASIYDAEHMQAEVLDALARALEGEDLAPMLAFFESEAGQRITDRELATRKALGDEEAEQEAREAAAVAVAEEDARVELLNRYIESLDLVEFNVVGTLNSNFAYISGLMDGGAMGPEATESDILADIWSQEGQIRADTGEWVLAFLLRAYEPLSDADIEALIDFSESDAGQTLNAAIFQAFDERFTAISRALGLAAARYMTTEEL